jgi:predicted nuclease of predicted toxin-antitoxin system
VIYWIPPQLANWLSGTFNVEAYALRDLQLRDAEDATIFQAFRRTPQLVDYAVTIG